MGAAGAATTSTSMHGANNLQPHVQARDQDTAASAAPTARYSGGENYMAGLEVRLAVNDAAIRNLSDEIEARRRRRILAAANYRSRSPARG